MLFVVEHPALIFSFCSVPLVAWIIGRSLNRKIITVILCVGIIFLLPILTGYSYVVRSAYGLLFYVVVSCSYSFVLRSSDKRLFSVVVQSITLAVVLGFVTFFAMMIGSINIEKEWELKGYKVRYVRDQGFSGSPLLKYELYEYGTIPIFIKQVDTKVDNDTTNNYIVKFEYKNIVLNKCLSD